MHYLSFVFYYVFKLATVKLGLHYTANPVSVAWRWRYWNRKRKSGRIR